MPDLRIVHVTCVKGRLFELDHTTEALECLLELLSIVFTQVFLEHLRKRLDELLSLQIRMGMQQCHHERM